MQVYWSNTICSLLYDVCRVRAIFQCITLLMFGMSDTYTAAEKLHDIVDDQVSLPFNLMPPKSMCILEFFTNGIHCVQTLQTDWLCQYSTPARRPVKLVCKTGIVSHCRIYIFPFPFHTCVTAASPCAYHPCVWSEVCLESQGIHLLCVWWQPTGVHGFLPPNLLLGMQCAVKRKPFIWGSIHGKHKYI